MNLRSLNFSALILLLAFVASAQTTAPEPIVSVPDINGRAVSLVKPAFPETAVAVGADGESVGLRVVVDENGNVVSAQCSTTCPSMLKDAAELAAMTSKFKPLEVKGRFVKYQGTLLYNFVVNRVSWFGFGTALESTRQFDNISFGPVAQILSSEYAAEKTILVGLDADGGANYDGRQKGIASVITSIKPKLKGIDLWQFDLGMDLRRATFWLMTGRINRVEMQKALEELETVIAAAPEGVSKQLIDDLGTISKFRIPAEMTDRELAKTINIMVSKIGRDPR